MDVEIYPRPSPDEQTAITEALSRFGGELEAASGWWRIGVEENLEAEVEGERSAR